MQYFWKDIIQESQKTRFPLQAFDYKQSSTAVTWWDDGMGGLDIPIHRCFPSMNLL